MSGNDFTIASSQPFVTLLEIENNVQVQMKTLIIGINQIDTKTGHIVQRDSTNTIGQTNEAKQQVSIATRYTNIGQTLDKSPRPEETLFVCQSVYDAFEDHFYSDEYLKKVLGQDDNTINYKTRMIGQKTFEEAAELLRADMNANIEFFKHCYISNIDKTRQTVATCVETVATNTIEMDNVVFLRSTADFKQANKSIQVVQVTMEALNKRLGVYDGKTESTDDIKTDIKTDGKVDEHEDSKGFDETNDDVKEIVDDTKNVINEDIRHEETDMKKIIFIIVLIVGICLIAGIIIVIYVRPQVVAGTVSM